MPTHPEEWRVVIDCVELCSYCGAACTGTFLIWYVEDGARLAFETDQDSLEEPMREWVGAAIESGEYDQLPSFVREWNESRGWSEFKSEGGLVEREDLRRVILGLARRIKPGDDWTPRVLAGLRRLIEEADGREIRAYDD